MDQTVRTFQNCIGSGQQVRRDTLVYSMGDAADDILLSFGLSVEEIKKYKTVKEKFMSILSR